jgi:uncharacterized protein with HEPN domain
MKPERLAIDYLRDIVEYADTAASFLEGYSSTEEFSQDRRTLLAVVRALEVIGEAARHIPTAIRVKYPNVPWRGMTRMRDKVIHDYFGVDAEVVWRTVKEDLPPCGKLSRRS